MRILSRRFLASYLSLYAAILFASTLVIIVVEVMIKLDDATGFGEGAWGVATYLLLRLPSYYLPMLVPIVSFAAAFFCLGLPARSQEIVAMKAGGISPQRICVPVLAAAAVLSAATLLMNETIVRNTAAEFAHQKGGSRASDLFAANGRFWHQRGPYLYNVREGDRATQMLYGVRVYERDSDGRLVRSMSAESAQISGGLWHLRDATYRDFDPAEPAAPPVVRHEEAAVLEVAKEEDLALLGANASGLSLLRLRDYIDSMRLEGQNVTRFRAQFHARLADPLSVWVLALVALPLGLAVERSRSLATSAIQGIAVVGVFYALQTATAIVAASGIERAVLAPWFILLAFATWGTWRFARVPA